MRFKNPYHFVPTGHLGNRPDLTVQQFRNTPKINHARYANGLYSGTLHCRLRLITPAVIGASQTRNGDTPAHVEPFHLNGQLAIPGSSLRGMISSIAEAASSSALRVLDQRPYTYHKNMNHPRLLSAIGMVVGEGQALYPLAMPTLKRPHGMFELPKRFHAYFPEPALKIYVGHSDNAQQDDLHIRQNFFRYRTSDPADRATWRYAAVTNFQWDNFTLAPRPDVMHISRNCLLGQKSGPPVEDRNGLWPGYMRVLGCWGTRLQPIPTSKKHELFLPFPTVAPPQKPIPLHVLQKFYDLADERTAEDPSLPFHPLDRPRGGPNNQIRLNHGDLVYFDVDENGEICEIAFSAIWRDRVETNTHEPATAHHFFRSIDAEILPFNSNRSKITPAEQLFGFATEDKLEGEGDKLTAYAGRVRFTDAALDQHTVPANGPLLQPVTLKILSSPKPPCPAMYFKPDTAGRRIPKHRLQPGDGGFGIPQGRKFYLHHFVPAGASPWERTINAPDQQSTVEPLAAGLEFSFQVHFDNLDNNDLGLLLYALCPEDTFHHKLGMGKSLGLGSTQITIARCDLINRQTRYTVAGLLADRISEQLDWAPVRNAYRDSPLVGPDIRNAFHLLGQIPANGQIPVHTPTMGNAANEDESFRWFVANEDVRHGGHEWGLRPLSANLNQLPTLEEY